MEDFSFLKWSFARPSPSLSERNEHKNNFPVFFVSSVQSRSRDNACTAVGFPQLSLEALRHGGRPPVRRHSETLLSSRRSRPLYLRHLSCVQRRTDPITEGWCETIARPPVKYRSRQSAKRSSIRRLSGDKPRHPAPLLRDVLENEHALCQDTSSNSEQRALAVFFSCFYSWMIDAYYHISDEGRDHSFIKWTFCVIMVTCAVLALQIGLTLFLLASSEVIVTLIQAALPFASFLLSALILYLAIMAIVNFRWEQTNSWDP